MPSFENNKIALPACPQCGVKPRKKIAWLKIQNRFTCQCGTQNDIDHTYLEGELVKIEDKRNKPFK